MRFPFRSPVHLRPWPPSGPARTCLAVVAVALAGAPLGAQGRAVPTIAEVRRDADHDFVPDRIGQVVEVVGVATRDPRMLRGSRFTMIQDSTAAIRVYPPRDTLLLAGVRAGDLLWVRGRLSQHRGFEQVLATEVRKVGTGPVPPPRDVLVADLHGERFSGQLVRVTGTLVKVPRPGDDPEYHLTDRSGATRVSIPGRFFEDGDLAVRLMRGGVVEVVAIASQRDTLPPYDSGYYLLAREPEDLYFAPIPPYRQLAVAAVIAGLALLALYLFVRRRNAERRAREMTALSDGLRSSEEALRRSEEHFRALIEKSTDIITILEADGTVRYHSPSAERVLGHPPEELEGRGIADYVHPDDQYRLRRAAAVLLKLNRGVVLQLRLRHRNGTWRVMEATGSNLLANPAVRAIVVNSRDVTDREAAKQRERELFREHSARVAAEAAEARIAEILESITDGFLAFDREWRSTYVNNRAEELLGAPRAEVLGRSMWTLYPELANTAAGAEIRRAMAERTPTDVEHPSERSPGRWLHFHVSPAEAGVVVYVRDITTRKHAVEGLRGERRRLAEAQRVARLGSWEFDLATGSATWSDEQFRIRGHEPQSFTPTIETFLASVHPEDRGGIPELGSSGLQAGERFHYEYRIVRPDGAVRVLFTQGEVIRDPAGEPVRIIGTDQDVTDRKEHEHALHQMGAALDASTDGICIVASDGTFRYANRAKARTLGYDSPNDLIGQSWRVAYPPEELARIEDEVLPLFALAGQWRGELTARRKDGGTFAAATSMTRIAGGDGWVAVDWDRTAEKQAEDELRRRGEMVRLLQMAAIAANESATLEQALHVVLEQVCHLTALVAGHASVVDAATGEMIPTNLWCTAHRERLAGFQHTVRASRLASGKGLSGRVLASAEPVWMEGIFADPDAPRAEAGASASLHAALAVPVLAGTEVVAVLEFFSENGFRPDRLLLDTLTHVGTQLGRVAERTRAESALQGARAEAERANQAKTAFLSRMSHELRTPLNAILGFGQLLEGDVQCDDDQESVEQILRAGRHLLGLINEVLDLARIEAGQMRLSVEPVSSRDAVAHSADLLRHMAAQQGITLRVEHSSAPEYFVAADLQRLRQVLLNLVSNAIKYNRPGGSVTLSRELSTDGLLRLLVQDTGAGLGPEKLERLFVPFERLDAENGAVEGTGLGLALSRGLMDAMGGRLGVESRPGEGSRFWAELPVVAGPEGVRAAAGTAEAPEQDADRAEPTHTVLLIEDNLANVHLMERVFRRRPLARLMVAMQGSVGLDLAREHHPSLILLDLDLPDLSGREVLLKLREDPALRDVPVVMVSGDAMPQQVERLIADGARAYITKPFNLAEVLQLVDDTVGVAHPYPGESGAVLLPARVAPAPPGARAAGVRDAFGSVSPSAGSRR